MSHETPIRVPTGRLSMLDSETLVYVPDRATICETRATLAHIYHTGIMRPVPGVPSARERVYPVEYVPTDDPHVYIVWLRNDHAELIEAKLVIRYHGTRKHPGTEGQRDYAELLDPFAT